MGETNVYATLARGRIAEEAMILDAGGRCSRPDRLRLPAGPRPAEGAKMSPEAVNLQAKLAKIATPWQPKIVAQLNDYEVRLARLEGEFVWHSHPETDELFLVLDGELSLQLRDGEVRLRPGELYVVPRGVEHCPRTVGGQCSVLLLEPAGTRNTGDAGGERTAPEGEWV